MPADHRDRPALGFDGSRPLSTALYLLGPYRVRVAAALVLFVVKDLPVWLVPAVTSSIIDVVVRRGVSTDVALLAVAGGLLLLSNYPISMAFVRLSSRVFRDVASRLRVATTTRL